MQEIAIDAGFETTSSDRGVRLVECAACTLTGARDLLRSAIENVVRNALKYTSPGTVVQIRLARPSGANLATILVEDEGPGVPPNELARIFEPFYRVEQARERQTGGRAWVWRLRGTSWGCTVVPLRRRIANPEAWL